MSNTPVLKRLCNIGIGKEITRGTAVSPSMWLQATDWDFQDQAEVVKTERTFGRQEAYKDQIVSKKWSEGQVSMEVLDQTAGYFLLGAFGSVSSAEDGDDAGVYYHAFSISQTAQNPSFTIVEKRGALETLQYSNAVVSSLDFDFTVGDYCKMTANLKGKNGASTSATPSYANEHVFVAKNVGVKLADDYSDLDTADNICVQGLTLSINNNPFDVDCLGYDTPKDFLKSQVEITGTINMIFHDTDQRDMALQNLAKAMRISIEDTNSTIGTSSHPALTIDLPLVKFESQGISGGANDYLSISLNFTGYYDLTGGVEKAISAVLTNTTASY